MAYQSDQTVRMQMFIERYIIARASLITDLDINGIVEEAHRLFCGILAACEPLHVVEPEPMPREGFDEDEIPF